MASTPKIWLKNSSYIIYFLPAAKSIPELLSGGGFGQKKPRKRGYSLDFASVTGYI